MSNPFAILNLPLDFEIDRNQVDNNYHELMRQYHPDRLVNLPESEKLKMVQKSTDINEAYNLILDDIARAQCLIDLALEAKTFDPESVVKSDNEFIFSQFTLRSQVDGLKSNFDMDLFFKLQEACNELRTKNLAEITQAFKNADYPTAQKLVHRLQFIRKLASELDNLEA